ncbi:unnamed protein product [Rotaria sordida]|uniref:Uncharacterized protein n=1 Tax=Rotaria sordida TaxID=392033 RepID=A0A819N988_9BILA|nr:unnamed protein product [Rotaria sordida]
MPAGRRHKINIRLGALNLPSPIQKHKRREVQEFILNYVEKAQEQSMITAVEEVVVEADIYVQRQPIQKYNAGRPPALDSAQIKQLDQTIQQNRSATAAELLSLTNFNTTERTIQRYRLFLGYRPRYYSAECFSRPNSMRKCFNLKVTNRRKKRTTAAANNSSIESDDEMLFMLNDKDSVDITQDLIGLELTDDDTDTDYEPGGDD